jgi:hypothetical protein
MIYPELLRHSQGTASLPNLKTSLCYCQHEHEEDGIVGRTADEEASARSVKTVLMTGSACYCALIPAGFTGLTSALLEVQRGVDPHVTNPPGKYPGVSRGG